MVVRQPLGIKATVRGGGLNGQAGAVRHGIARALTLAEPDLHFFFEGRRHDPRRSRERA